MTITRPGLWCDVATHPSGFAFGWTAPGIVVAEVNGVEVWRQSIPTDHLRFLRIACSPEGAIVAVGQGNDGLAYLVTLDGARPFGPTFGTNCVAIRHHGRFEVYTQTGPATYRIATLDGSGGGTFPMSQTSQGIRDIAPDGSIVLGDLTYSGVIDGHPLWQFCRIPGAVAGQLQDGVGAIVDGSYFRAHTSQVANGVHIARLSSRIAICAATEQGSWYGEFVPPYPVVPVVPAPPPPPPPPKEDPMPVAPNQLDVVRAVMISHPHIDRMTDGVRGAITDLVVQALGGVPWGRKDRDRNPDNNNNSDDALCYRLPDGRFEIYDIISGVDGSATWAYAGTFADGENGFFREVATKPPPPPVPPVPPPTFPPIPAPPLPDPRIDGILFRLADLERSIAQLAAVMVKRGDPVEVKGAISVAFLGTKTITSKGTL